MRLGGCVKRKALVFGWMRVGVLGWRQVVAFFATMICKEGWRWGSDEWWYGDCGGDIGLL